MGSFSNNDRQQRDSEAKMRNFVNALNTCDVDADAKCTKNSSHKLTEHTPRVPGIHSLLGSTILGSTIGSIHSQEGTREVNAKSALYAQKIESKFSAVDQESKVAFTRRVSIRTRRDGSEDMPKIRPPSRGGRGGKRPASRGRTNLSLMQSKQLKPSNSSNSSNGSFGPDMSLPKLHEVPSKSPQSSPLALNNHPKVSRRGGASVTVIDTSSAESLRTSVTSL